VTRIITVDLRTFKTKQYLYLLDDPATTGDANSEITSPGDSCQPPGGWGPATRWG
jgi:hypothetical protein